MDPNDEIKVDLDHILAQVAKTQNINRCELIPNTTMNYGDGFVAQFFTGEIKNLDTEETISVAIKKAPFWEYDYKALFTNEQLFYETIFPALDNLQNENNVLQPFDNVPNFFCGNTLEPKKEYIAMENIKPLGYVMFDKKKFFDQEHLDLIFKTYGKFHALSFVLRNKNLKEYQNITKKIVDLDAMLPDLVSSQLISSISAAVNALDAEKYEVMCDELRDFGKNAGTTFKNSFKYDGEHRCLVHGDCWSNNMMFKYSESGKLLDIKLLDFQICRDGSPIYDLSYFFYSGASKKDFDNIEYFLQKYYKSFCESAKELGANPNELLSFETLVKEWKENALFGVMFGIWLWQIKLTSKEDFNKMIQDAKGFSQEEMGQLWQDFIEKVYESSLYKENTTSILIHAYEYGIIKK